jgi:SAM-dependent methyltransferase
MSADDSKPSAAAPPEGTPRAVGRGELFVTVFVTGAAVMTIEMVGTRLIGPVFGVGLFVWSALLAVTLASLAGGYYAGGVLADRRLDPRLLSKAVVSAGLALLLAPLLHRWALGVAEGMGMRVGPLFAATLLFAPSLVSLGAAGPISVKLATSSLAAAGRGVGGVYAVLALGLLLLPLFIGQGGDAHLPPGLSLVAKSQSLLGLVEVIRDENRGVRFLRSDHSVLGAAYEKGGSSAFAFVEILAAIRFFQPEAESCLNIGLGTGAVPSMLGRNGIEVDVVEIDPAVVELTKKHFDFTPTGHVYVEDARALLQRTQRRYDLIVHDTFTGGTTPEHLLSVEVLERVRSILRPGGVFALNFAGFYGGVEAEATYAVARTVRAIFPHVRAYRDSAPELSGPVGNIVFFASLSPLEFKILPNARFDTERMEHFVRGKAAWPILEQVPPGPLVTDARNALARLQLPIAERHFAAMNEMLPAEVWLN